MHEARVSGAMTSAVGDIPLSVLAVPVLVAVLLLGSVGAVPIFAYGRGRGEGRKMGP